MPDDKPLSLEDKRRLAKELLDQRARATARAASESPTAIVGIGCRFPGGVVDPREFWRLLEDGVDAIGPVPPSRWDAAALYDPDPAVAGRSTTRFGGFIDDVDAFDPEFFGINAREAVHLDPQQRLLIETTWEALEHAGIAPHSLAGSQTGVFVGHMAHDYERLHPRNLEALDGYVMTGNAASVASGRISYLFDLRGPCFTLDTACSSSLVTLHLACRSLRSGECDLALAGGVTLVLAPDLSVEFARMRGLAPDGRCKSFSDAADGVGWSEGCGMIVLRRLDDALRAGDRILGVVRGSAINHDGRSNGLTAPNGPAQIAVLRRALASAGLGPHEVDFVEAHGTGTPLGDPIEAQALAAVYGAGRDPERPLRIGSAKSNFGHSQAAAGIAGVIKVLLAFEHERLPASLHASRPSSHVAWESSGLRVTSAPEPWPRGPRRRVAGVSAFGISGTNAHVVIEEPPDGASPASAARAAHAVFVSGDRPEALAAEVARLADHVEANPDVALADLAHTLARGRSHFSHRSAVVASSSSELVRELRGTGARGPTVDKVGFLCTGQGAQYAGMAHGLYASEPVFRAALDAAEQALAPHLRTPLYDVLFGDLGVRIDQTELTQPAMFAVGIALAALWRAWGMRPAAVMGHSVGEYVAAHVGGVFSLEDGAMLIAARGRAMQERCAPGAMAAIDCDEARVAAVVTAFAPQLAIAAVNGPSQTVISGRAEAVDAACAALAGVRVRRLAVSHAFHSPMMEPMIAAFADVAVRVRFAHPTIPFVSNITGAFAGDEVANADYWVRHVGAPVRFADGVRALHAAGVRGFVEVGPQPTLLGMAAACLPQPPALSIPSLRKGRDDVATMLRGACALWERGVEIDIGAVASAGGGRRIALPTRAFQRRRLWIETTPDVPAAPATGHPLLGRPLAIAGIPAAFESTISVATLPWLPDHHVFDALVVPGAAILDWVQAACDARFGAGAQAIAELVLERALVVPDDGALHAQLHLTEREAIIYSRPTTAAGAWTRHASARLVSHAESRPPARVEASGVALAPAAMYDAFDAAGLHFGPTFRALRRASRLPDGTVVADVELDRDDAARYGLHPAVLDAALQSLTLADGGALGGELSLPLAFRDARITGWGARTVRVHTRLVERTPEVISGSFTIWDDTGACVAEIGRLDCKRVSARDFRPPALADELAYAIAWHPVEAVRATGPAPRVAIVGERTPLAVAVAARVQPAEDADAVVVFLPCGDAADAETHARAMLRFAHGVAPTARRVVVVVERACAVVPGDDVVPAAAAAWAIGRVLAEEHGGAVTLVDATLADASTVVAIVDELADVASGEVQVALRAGRRYVARAARVQATASATRLELAGGAVVITGGLGAIGLAIGKHLVETHGAHHLALVGRTPPDDATRAALARLPARVDIVLADVADRDALAAGLRELAGSIRGVVHAAGVGDAAFLAALDDDRLARTFAAKVRGAANLDELTRHEPLALFLLVSSLAAFAPMVGQGAYAAANAFLDGLAHHRRAHGRVATAIDFGPWAGAGMMNRLPSAERARLVHDGTLALEPDVALVAMDAAIARGDASSAVLSLDLERRRASFGERPVPAFWRQLIRARRAPVDRGESIRARLHALAGDERGPALEAFLRGEVARALSLPSPERVPIDRTFAELGVDSLTGLDLRNRIASALGVDLAAAVIWEHPTVPALSRHLASRLGDAAPAPRERPRIAALLALHPDPSHAPIFGVGGVLGGSTYLRDLAAELGPLQPFYTASYPGLDDDAAPLARIEDLAAYFVEILRAARPQGPYIVAGHSFGGLVAYEMAQQLVTAGAVVDAVVLFDAWSSAMMRGRKLSPDDMRLDELVAPFVAAGHLSADLSGYADRFRRIATANLEALERYEPRSYDGAVTLLVPEDDLFQSGQSPDGWRALCQRLVVRRTAGNHATMLLPPHHKTTARILRNALRDAERARDDVVDARRAPSISQRWMWLVHQLDPGPTYNVYFGVRLRGAVDRAALDRAIADLSRRHDSLRSRFEEAAIIVDDTAVLAVEQLDARDGSFEAVKAAFVARPFDLARAPLGRVALIASGPDEHVLALVFHHIVVDGASCAIVMRDALAFYEHHAMHTPLELPALPWTAADHALWEAEHIDRARHDQLQTFWRGVVADLPRWQLPARSGGGEGAGVIDLAIEDARALRRLAEVSGCSLYVVLAAAWSALLARYAGIDELGFATVVANRPRAEMRDLVGCFVNTVLLRADLSGAPTVAEHLARTQARLLAVLDHQELSYDEVTRLGGSPLTGACFVFENPGKLSCERVVDTVSADVAGTAKFDLTLAVEDTGGDVLHGNLIYRRLALSDAAAARMTKQLATVLRAMARDPRTSVTDLPLLDADDERRIVVEWNATARTRDDAPRLHELVLAQAARTPDAIAITHVATSTAITYAALAARATRLASQLHLAREARVGLCVPRTPELIIGALAVLAAGGAYVPLDPAYPRARLRYMLDDSGCDLVLVAGDAEASLGDISGRRLVRIDQDLVVDPVAPASGGDRDLAYLIYTSGSTGAPKAVAIEHRSAVELVRWALETFDREELAGVLASTSICFDLSIFELFVPLAAGGRVVLATDAFELARAGDVRLVNTVPSIAAELLRQDAFPPSVRTVNLAGEPLSSALVDALYARPHVRRVNDLYGPSETTTYSTWTTRQPGARATVGRPIANTQVYILDERRRPVPVGVAGEIYIGGAGVARGYHARPDLTEERFVPNPFVDGTRMYRTGDRARFAADGEIELLGRLDTQVKLRGVRIELGEIEAAMQACDGIAECAVVVREDVAGDARLVAYVVAKDAPRFADVRAYLARSLPAAMLPQHVVTLPALPRTPNGKLDRARLPPPERSSAVTHDAPATVLERTIAAIWEAVLGVDGVGRDAHFFELGGHSLQVIQVTARVREHLGRDVLAVELYREPVLRAYAAGLVGAAQPAAATAKVTGKVQREAIRKLGDRFRK